MPPRSPLLCRLFQAYLRRYVARHFHALRVTRAGRPTPAPAGPLLVVANHPSWWDPLIAFLLADRIGRAVYAPVEAAALARYPFLRRLGLFGVDLGTAAGARTFLRVGRTVLEAEGAMLAVTPQGRFTDVRERPVRLRPGVGHLVARIGRGHVLPVALEYPFWSERTPEALVHCGPPMPVEPGRSADDWTARIAAGLEAAQDALAAAAVRRDPADFETVVAGRTGVGRLYDGWRRVGAWARGRRFDPAHGPGGDR